MKALYQISFNYTGTRNKYGGFVITIGDFDYDDSCAYGATCNNYIVFVIIIISLISPTAKL